MRLEKLVVRPDNVRADFRIPPGVKMQVLNDKDDALYAKLVKVSGAKAE